jgi:hypothetical protein
MKNQRLLVTEDTAGAKTFSSAIRKIEGYILAFYELYNELSPLTTGEQLISAINEPKSFLEQFYASKIVVPEKDPQTQLPIIRELYINDLISKLQLPDISRVSEISKLILKSVNEINVSLEQCIKKGDILSVYSILDGQRLDSIIDGRFREYTNGEIQKSFIVSYEQVLKSVNHLSHIFTKHTGGKLRLLELMKDEGEGKFNIHPATWLHFKNSCNKS